MAVMAVVLVAVVGALAFVVDLGFQMETRRELQNAADAGALAGVALLPDDQAGSIQQAITFAYQGSNASVTDRICGPAVSPLPDAGATAPAAHANVYSRATPGQLAVTGGNIYTMTVTMECTANFSFGRILNLTTAPIRASATAARGSPKYVSCTFPMAVYDSDGNPSNGLQDAPWNGSQTYQVGQYYPMYMKGDNGSSSNSGALDAGSGANDIRNAISNNCSTGQDIVSESGCSGGVTPPCANTKSGVMSGPIQQGLTQSTARYPSGRMQSCPGSSPYCAGQALASSLNNISLPGGSAVSISADLSCTQKFSDVVDSNATVKAGQSNSPCLAVVPITSVYVNQNGTVNIPIEGYAMVFLAAYQKSGEVLAVQFVKNVEVQSDIAAYNPLGSFVIRLIG
jgi:Flp pilus assembly protein TadG